MRILAIGMSALLLGTALGVQAETLMVAQDYAVDSDVVLESAVREIKSAPRDSANVIGDTVKFFSDETVTAAKGVAAVFKSDPHAKAQRAGELEVENAWTTANDILFRSYKVTDEVGSELMQGEEVPEGSTIDVSSAFAGVKFPKRTSVFYRPEFNKLFVRQTLENILTIEDVLADMHNASRELLGHQVEIETKFVEVNQSTLDELGFNWYFDGENGGSLNVFDDLWLPAQDILVDGLRTATGPYGAIGAGASVLSDTLTFEDNSGSQQFTLIIRAMEQAEDTDVLSAPRVVTRDGNTATILVGEERMVPKSFQASSQNTSVYVEHSDWDFELMGVTLEVTPEIRSEDLIDLEIKPKVIDLIGYDTYQITPDNARYAVYAGNSSAKPDIALPVLNGSLPYFRLREMETQVTVQDGSTVGMGGLIYDKVETFRDKVPVLGSIPYLGRLFRSEGEQSIKRNLMIFVTATQVDVNGRRASDLALKK